MRSRERGGGVMREGGRRESAWKRVDVHGTCGGHPHNTTHIHVCIVHTHEHIIYCINGIMLRGAHP